MFSRIGIGWLDDQGFCEYKLILRFVRHYDPVTLDITKGLEAHAKLGVELSNEFESKEYKQLSDVKSLRQELIESSANIDSNGKFYSTNFGVECDLMIGRMDEFELTNDLVIIGEHKTKARNGIPFYGEQRQVLGYAYCFRRQYPEILLPIKCFIRDKFTGEIFWTHMYNKQDEIEVLDAAHRSLDIVNGSRIAVPCSKINGCLSCRYHQFKLCDKDLAKGVE
jgi:hypothetical protein